MMEKVLFERFNRIAYHVGIVHIVKLVLSTIDASSLVEEDATITLKDLRERLTDAITHSEAVIKEQGGEGIA